MEVLRNAPLSRGGWVARAWPGLVLGLGLLAYRPLLADILELPSAHSAERWLFRPSALPVPVVLAAAAWLVWRRRERLAALPARAAPWTAAALAGLGGACFAWAFLTRAADLLFLSLSAHLLAFAAATRGRAGCRALALPAGVLLFGLRIPAPLLDEVVWHLQLWTAAGSARLLQAAGSDIVQAGVILREHDHTFQVIDACSGLQGTLILALVAILTRELFADSGARQWLLLALTPALGFALNLVRVAYVASSSDPEALAGIGGDHTPQGVAVLAAGTGILYGLGWWMARSAEGSRPAAGAAPLPRWAPWGPAAVWLGALALLPLFVTPFPPRATSTIADGVRFPESAPNWTSEALPVDPLFIGVLPTYQRIHRRFELQGRPPQVVELFVANETPELPRSSELLSSKLRWPGPDWNRLRGRRERLWLLDRDADLSVTSRPSGQCAVVYTWRLRDRGLWSESWRALLALDSSPFHRKQARTVVRLVTYAPFDGSLAFDRAKQRLDRFISDFREELVRL